MLDNSGFEQSLMEACLKMHMYDNWRKVLVHRYSEASFGRILIAFLATVTDLG